MFKSLTINVYNIIKYVLWSSLANFISIFFRKDPDLILFSAMGGTHYGDNSRHLYEWYLENSEKSNAVWLTKNKSIYERLKIDNKPVELINSFRGIRLLCKAKAVCFTNSVKDFSINAYFIPKGLSLIALRHGRSVKKIRFARENHKISFVEELQRKHETKKIRCAISTSEFVSEIQEKCLLIGRNKHVVTGYPRNDKLYNSNFSSSETWRNFIDGCNPQKIILYGPSWRHGRVPTKFFPFDDFEKDAFVEFLETNKILMLLRPHLKDLVKYEQLNFFLSDLDEVSSYIKLATHDIFPDVNTILPAADVLISDYSALYHDFLLLDRPLLFIPYDYDDFEKQNGFLYDYKHYLPGPAVNTVSELSEELKLIVNGEDRFSKKRTILKDLIHKHQDNRSCERVSLIIDKIKK